jgi:hypothetical protein
VLSTAEVQELIAEHKVDLTTLEDAKLDAEYAVALLACLLVHADSCVACQASVQRVERRSQPAVGR